MVINMARFDESEYKTIEKMLGRASSSNTLHKLNLRVPEYKLIVFEVLLMICRTCINDENNFKVIMEIICKNTGLQKLSFTSQK